MLMHNNLFQDINYKKIGLIESMDYTDPKEHAIVLYLLSNSLFQDIIKNLP